MHATCVIYNPAAGRGRAERLLNALPPSLASGVELRPTTTEGHAVELARRACDDGFAKVVAAGGDGTVHEVANGVLQSGRRDVVFGTWPIGSANDFAFTLGLDVWWKIREQNPPLDVLEIDVGRVTAPGRERFFVDSVGIGFNGMVTIESRKTKWLAGLPLYAWAFLKAMVRHFATPPMTVRFDGHEITGPTLALSILNAQREGNFPLRPNASLTDGQFDYMHAKGLTRLHLVRYLPAMVRGKLPEGHPRLALGRASRIEVQREAPLCVHADGEFVCVPEEGVKGITIEVLPQRLKVEVYRPALYGGLQ
ncbi:diacylglycerol kinase family lipid kinase [Gemmata sp. JC673]|uniref:Diacylglycerol kinase family lipid kinase n=1 Tax=Gemmata algarum TaxID=2975278 RepID=A0ABU5F2H2_9BACT|nr:diacylglycerol kinase family protein [Gemmata algarum]MDY3561760.1 diacylglycerol kinase family lipid kinase [Gemmata algarum]